jgi:hypothetical protein
MHGLFVYTFPFSRPHKKKSGLVKSGELVTQRPFEIIWFPKKFGTLHPVVNGCLGKSLSTPYVMDAVSQGLRYIPTTFDHCQW